MKLNELFENHNFLNGRAVKQNLMRAQERIMEVIKTMGDRLDPKKASQVKNIQLKLKTLRDDPVSDEQANKYAEQVHAFVEKLHASMSNKQVGDRPDLRDQKNDKQAKREMRDEVNEY